ncbi:hypothetical protein [Frigoriglobus tundricola]|uniref:hypothetical protein n=1 Tax=Frigoriglobus tundricola TaxID=2774151 RepID=UPI00148EC600|nr:hypothetical protein [Frigoriglobus tundricola]
MSQITERTAEQLAPVQAAELAAVIDAQARWENLRGEPSRGGDGTPTALQNRQKAYEAFRSRQAAYTTQYRTAPVSETTLNTPDRLGEWCRTARAVLLRAETAACPAHLIAKAHRLADRIATRLGTTIVERGAPVEDTAGAIRELTAVIAWCETGSGSAPHVLKAPGAGTTEPLVKVA